MAQPRRLAKLVSFSRNVTFGLGICPVWEYRLTGRFANVQADGSKPNKNAAEFASDVCCLETNSGRECSHLERCDVCPP